MIKQEKFQPIKYRVLPTWKKVHASRARIKYIVGSVGSGKTTGAFIDLYLLALRNMLKGFKKSIFYVFRNSYPQLRDSTVQSFFETFGCDPKKFNVTRMEYVMKIKKAHQIIWRFRAIEDTEKDLLKLDGYLMTGAYIDEVVNYETPNILHKCNLRCRWPAKTVFQGKTNYADHEVICTSNPPPSKEHWVWQLFFANNPDPKLYQGWQQPLDENVKNLPPNYYEDLTKSLPTYLRQRYVEGRPVPMPTGAEVYIKFDSKVHVKNIVPFTNEPLLRGWDFGTANPACVITQIVFVDKDGNYIKDPSTEDTFLQLRIYDEITQKNLNIREFAKIVKSYCESKYGLNWHYLDFCDPHGMAKTESSTRTAWQQLIEEGIHPVPGAIEIRERILAVQFFLDTEHGLLINPTCTKLITGFEGGYHKVKIKGVVIDKISKNDVSHPHDALQMVCTVYPAIITEKTKQKTISRYTYNKLKRLRII